MTRKNKNSIKRKKSSTTSCSDLEQSQSLENSTLLDETTLEIPKVKKTKSKQSNKKQKVTMEMNETSETSETNQSSQPTLDSRLDEISKKLSNMLTKDDRSFIKTIIKETVEEIKESMLASVTKRIEILENDLHEKTIEAAKMETKMTEMNTNYEKKIENLTQSILNETQKQKKENESYKEEKKINDKKVDQLNQRLVNETEKLKTENNVYKEKFNDLEQYGRRNNIRITGIKNDSLNQTTAETTRQVREMLKNQMDVEVGENEIDIAHRLGKFDENKPTNRPIIVKFVSRQKRMEVMSNAKKLKETNFFINEDLTRLNHEVLMSVRLKATNRVDRAWSLGGRIYAVYKGAQGVIMPRVLIPYQEFDEWLGLPWPKKK